MAQLDGHPDHAAPVLVTQGWSPKTIAAGLWALILPILIPFVGDLLGVLTSNPELFAGLPAPVRFIITGVLSAAGVAYAAWKARPGVVIPESGSRGV